MTATTMPRVGRPVEYTPEMDAIILSTTDGAEINRRFAAMGAEQKSAKAIVARRHYLKKFGIVGNNASPVEERLAKVMAMRRTIEAELASSEERAEELRSQLADLTEEAERLGDELRQTLSGET